MNDLVDRRAAIDDLHGKDPSQVWYTVDVEVWVNALPSVQPERKKGRWERHNTYHGDDTSGFIDPDWKCSECGRQANVNEWFMYDLTDFCPNCGADMRGVEDEQTERVC